MKINFKYKDKEITKEEKQLINDFVRFLQTEYPLKNDLTIEFLGEKESDMTTGSHNEELRRIRILSKNRINRDVLRTLAHEWVHDYQRNILKRERGQDIGGRNEDEANAFAGQLMKKFEKKFPNKEPMMYEGLNRRLNLINEQILLTEKNNVKQELILEMEKIGIDKLPYSYSSLEKFIDSETMDIHYNKHYKGYVKKLNDALSEKKYKYIDLEDIITKIDKFNDKIRNNAGGAFNHALFWKMLSPKKQLPKGEILNKIKKQFGNIKKLKDEFNTAAKDRFGSGWVWLVLTKNNRLKILTTPNQDNPLMNIIKDGGYPLLGLDLWEHAYYLKYRNKRDQYIEKFWDCVNWEFVNDLYLSKVKKTEDKTPINESVSLKEKLQNLVKKHGWQRGVISVGEKNLLKLGFNNDPMEFLNLFNDLDVVQSEEKPDWTLFRYKPKENLMIYNRKNDTTYFDYYKIWSVLQESFGLNYDETQEVTKRWLGEVYNLRGITTSGGNMEIASTVV
jgi:superoxide dismutase, Fe-Mn family